MRRYGRRGAASLLVPMVAFVVPWLVSAAGSGRPGQTRGQAKEPLLQHEVTVTLKLIQVFVTDAAGKPALDLEKSDFVVRDNGRIQAITDFEKHLLALPAAGKAAAPAPVPSARAEPPLLSRRFIFLIDYVRNTFEGVQKAKSAALEFLDSKVGPDDEVGLFTLSPTSSLTLCEYLTKDHDKVRHRIKKLREFIGGGGEPPSSDPMGMELMNAQIFSVHGGHVGPSQRNLFADIAEWAKALRAIPGQKNVILFTMGFGNAVVRPGRLNNVLFENMARALASANAPVFTVDTSPQVVPGRDIEDKLPSGTLAERSLAYLSETTGGQYLGGVNFQTRIASDIQAATANYYVLGYSIPASWDGKYHEIKVDVARPGYVVHAQRGYFNPVPFGALTPIEKHLHLLEVAFGEGASGQRTGTFPLAALPFPRGGGTDTLLLAEFPGDLREALGDRVEFISLVLNEGQAIADGKRWEVDPKDLQAPRIFQYSLAALAPGRYDVRAVLRNLDDGRAMAGACQVDVAPAAAAGPAMYPPLFLVPGTGARYLNLTPSSKAGEPAGFSISEAFPFPAGEYVPLVGALEAGATSLWADLTCVWRDARAGEKDLSVRLLPADRDDEIPVTVVLLSASSRDDRDFYLLRCEFPALAPGRYRVEIRAADEATETTATASGRFSVRPAGR